MRTHFTQCRTRVTLSNMNMYNSDYMHSKQNTGFQYHLKMSSEQVTSKQNKQWRKIGMNPLLFMTHIAWKASKYGVISGPYFPVFAMNTEMYPVNLCIQSEYRKIRSMSPYLDTPRSDGDIRSLWLSSKRAWTRRKTWLQKRRIQNSVEHLRGVLFAKILYIIFVKKLHRSCSTEF